MGKQAHKIQFSKKLRIYDISYMSLLELDIIKQGQVGKTMSRLKFENNNNSEKYKVEIIYDSKVYAKKSDNDHHLSNFYYFVLQKDYPKEENI